MTTQTLISLTLFTAVVTGRAKNTPANACKYYSAQLIIYDIYPLRPGPDTSKHLSSLFGRFDIDEGNPLHLLETEHFLRQNDFQSNPENQVILKFMRDPGLIPAYLENRVGIDATLLFHQRGDIGRENPKIKVRWPYIGIEAGRT